MQLNDDLRSIAGEHPERVLGRRIFVSERSDSTQADARAALKHAGGRTLNGAVFTTLHQTEGRGTRGRSWWAPPDSSLPLSIVLAPSAPLPYPAAVTLVTALALHDAGTERGAKLLIRWPNDIVDTAGRKIAGVLAETIEGAPQGFVIGIGINVRPSSRSPPPELDQPIGDLMSAALSPPTSSPASGRASFALLLLEHLERRFASFAQHGLARIVADFNARSYLAGRQVALRHGARRIEGTFHGMTARFEVEISPRDGTRIALAAEQLELIEHRNLG